MDTEKFKSEFKESLRGRRSNFSIDSVIAEIEKDGVAIIPVHQKREDRSENSVSYSTVMRALKGSKLMIANGTYGDAKVIAVTKTVSGTLKLFAWRKAPPAE